MRTIDFEPPIPPQSIVYPGCRQETETPNKEAVLHKAEISKGFFMNKHAQDAADAEEVG